MLDPPLAPYARALRDYHEGDRSATLVLHSSLGEYDDIPVAVFFRDGDGMFPFDIAALEVCRGRVLDAGAGTGLHALALQERDLDVTAVDVLPEAVDIMKDRGVTDARRADIFALEGERFDTILMLMNGVGPCGTLDGLDHFLARVPALLNAGGQLVVDSGTVHRSDPPPGAPAVVWPPGPATYIGESWIQLTYGGRTGEPFRELYIDAGTLAQRATKRGWSMQIVFEGEGEGYVALLRPPIQSR